MRINPLAPLLATWFGCGYSPLAPGTAGAIGALLPVALLMLWTPIPGWTLLIPTILLTPPAIWAASEVARHRGLKDPGLIVIDEVLGQWLALCGAADLTWKALLGAFVLFRLFDIWKPSPVRELESLPGGRGIIADDLMAGFYAALVLYAARWFNLY